MSYSHINIYVKILASYVNDDVMMFQACQRLCEQDRVRSQCGCFNEEKTEENDILGNPDNLGPCRTQTGR